MVETSRADIKFYIEDCPQTKGRFRIVKYVPRMTTRGYKYWHGTMLEQYHRTREEAEEFLQYGILNDVYPFRYS